MLQLLSLSLLLEINKFIRPDSRLSVIVFNLICIWISWWLFVFYLHTEAIRKREQTCNIVERFITTQEISSISSSIALLNIINYASLLHSRVFIWFLISWTKQLNSLITAICILIFFYFFSCLIFFCLFIFIEIAQWRIHKSSWKLHSWQNINKIKFLMLLAHI